jgi:hypothetical protein
MARSAGAAHVDTGQRDLFGFETVAGLDAGSTYVEYGFGLPPEPACNIPMTACEDPHSEIRKLQEADDQLDLFLRTGETQNFCPDGVCGFPEMGGCTGADETPTCPP